MKKMLSLIAVALMAVLVFIGCPISYPIEPEITGEPLEGIADGGPFTATGYGVGYAADPGHDGKAAKEGPYEPGVGTLIPVTVIVNNRFITSVEIGNHAESTIIAGRLLERMPGVARDRNTFELLGYQVGMDVVGGATLTFNGIREAGLDALAQIRASHPMEGGN
ncbi:MAG: FMN-binding protein [Treponema sp.]|nr:FMN-binding protein [Treponema sp.]